MANEKLGVAIESSPESLL